RDRNVTGVQTCALPIFAFSVPPPQTHTLPYNLRYETLVTSLSPNPHPPNEALIFRPSSSPSQVSASTTPLKDGPSPFATTRALRSEERRVGKESTAQRG